MPFQLSPGVAVVEKDFTSIVPAVSSSIGAFAGVFPWGPVLEPVTVSSENDLVRRFGKPNDSNFQSFFTAANFLSYTNNLLLVRADAGSLNAVASESGGLGTVSVNNEGSGYSSTAAAPSVTVAAPDISGGTQAVVTVTLSGGAITAVAVSSAGSGYSSAPSVTISAPSGGSGATFSVVMSGTGSSQSVASVTVTAGGSGYKGTVTASFSAGNATAGSVTIASSTIASATIVTAGTGYSTAPLITVAAPPSGTTATLNKTISVAGLKIINGETYNTSFVNGAGVIGAFAAKYPGTLGNSLKVAVCDSADFATWTYKDEFDSAPGTSTYAASVGGTQDEMHIIVIDEDGAFSGSQGTILEKFAYVSKASDAKKPDGTNNYYKNVINSRSEYIWWMDHVDTVTGTTAWGSAAAGASFKLLNDPLAISLAGGTDDFVATDGETQSAFALFANAEAYDISLIMAGKATAATATYIINNICETRLDCVAFVSPQSTSTADPIIGSTSTQQNAIIAYRDALPSTSYAVLDSGYKYQYDRYNDQYRYVPLNGDIAGLCARTDYTNDPWFSPGGLNRGQIKNVVKLAFNPSKTQRDMLYKSGVNPVVTFPGEGTVMFGDKTLLAKPSAFDRINVRRLFIVMEKAIATAAKFQLFEFNDGFTRAQFKNLVEPFLRDVQGRRGITDFVVKCDESNNTGEVIDRNEFVADIFVKPNRSINFITLNFVAARSAINFSEIGA
jgi:phage tail sheath protein FI